jgi:hypothetical protein
MGDGFYSSPIFFMRRFLKMFHLIKANCLPLFAVLVLSSCTQESKVKSIALDAAEKYFAADLTQESAQVIHGKETYKINYVSTIKNKTQFEVSDVHIAGDVATASVLVQTVHDSARITLMEIIEKQKNENSFVLNLSNALNLIYTQLKFKQDSFASKIYQIQLKSSQDDWKAISYTVQTAKTDPGQAQ